MGAVAQDCNVLFIISDQHKKDVTGCYGDAIVKTPAIDALAAKGLRFDRAYCSSPVCTASRASIMTGTYPHVARGFDESRGGPLRDLPTLGSVFRSAGYRTASLGKVHIIGETDERDLGFDERAMRYYTYHYRDYVEAIGEADVRKYKKGNIAARDGFNARNQGGDLTDERMYDTLVTNLAIDFMTRHRGGRFFAWVGLEKPHPTWYAPEEYHRLYDPAQMPLPGNLEWHPDWVCPLRERMFNWGFEDQDKTADRLRGSIAAYYANVTYMDTKVGQLLAALEALGLRDDTIVLYTSDHGEHLFEHRWVQKHCCFEAAVAVPLIVCVPGLAGGVRSQLVSLMDLFPTLLDLTGIAHPDTLQGVSQADVLASADAPGRDAVIAENYTLGVTERMILNDDFKYICNDGYQDELYDVKRDRLEMTNLALDPAYRGVCDELKARLMAGWKVP